MRIIAHSAAPLVVITGLPNSLSHAGTAVMVGKLPIEGIFPPGQHQIVVRAAGIPDQTRVANVAAGQRVAMEVDFNATSRAASSMTRKPDQSNNGAAGDQTPRPARPRVEKTPTYRSKEDFERARDAAYERFDAQWDARKNALKREKDYYDNQADNSEGAAKERWKKKKEDADRRLDQLDDQQDAAKQALKRQWKDD